MMPKYLCKSFWVLCSWDDPPEILDRKPTKKSRPADWYLFQRVGIPVATLEGYRRAKKEAQAFWSSISPHIYHMAGSLIREPLQDPFAPRKCTRTHYFDDNCKEFQYRG